MHFNHPIQAGRARVKKLYRQPVRWTRLFQIYGFFFTLLSFLWHPLPDHGQLPSCSSCCSFISRASPAQLLAVVSPVDLILFGKEFLDFLVRSCPSRLGKREVYFGVQGPPNCAHVIISHLSDVNIAPNNAGEGF